MNTLLFQINEQTNTLIEEQEMMSKNIELLAEYVSMTPEELNEAATSWLAGILGAISKGKLDNTKKPNIVKILGALEAVSNPDLADALDEKGDLANILQSIGDKDKNISNSGLYRMLDMGNHPSVKTFVGNAEQALNDPATASTYIKNIQTKIDQVMRKRLHLQQRQKMS